MNKIGTFLCGMLAGAVSIIVTSFVVDLGDDDTPTSCKDTSNALENNTNDETTK